jgi:ribonuclease HII
MARFIEKERKAREKYEKELLRTESLSVYEHRFEEKGLIAGVDEVGRGPLAGPVMAGAVILPKDHPVLYLNDSKKLSPKKRAELYDVIIREALSFGVGMEEPETIDEINILNATYSAMRKALRSLEPSAQFVLVDAVTIPDILVPQCPIIKGDAKSVSIAAASILAKVKRDRMMEEYDSLYPEYHFAQNKGYGTKEHMEALRKYGPCPIHRRSFIGGILDGKG